MFPRGFCLPALQVVAFVLLLYLLLLDRAPEQGTGPAPNLLQGGAFLQFGGVLCEGKLWKWRVFLLLCIYCCSLWGLHHL